jgi:putative glutamine amidotransferase
MKKPRILVSGNKDMQAYIQAVEMAGGIADGQKLPQVNTEYDGLLLCGGNDIDPAFYGEPMNGAVEIHRERDDAEFALVRAYVKAGKPIFGICRGFQLLNVYFGGTLHQHLADADTHTNTKDYARYHDISSVEGSFLQQLYGKTFGTNTYHHQGIKKLGEGLIVAACFEGLPEAFRHETLPIIAVQWHPERICGAERPEGISDGLALFRFFLELCGKKEQL